jgi:predicted dienelactone hydrolase
MRSFYQTVSAFLAQFILFVSTATAAGVGFQEVKISDPVDRPLRALIWYPSDEATQLQPLAGYQQIVALNGTVAGEGLPLVVISHGTGGSALGHHDTAFALAEAGFVVVALTHSGDNYADMRYYATRMQLTERPRHISLAIDYMLQRWSQRGAIDGDRIGIFGFSIGGYTALVGLGGEPDLSGLSEQCEALPQKWACREFGLPADLVRKFGTGPLDVIHDKRLKAAFVAAPAIPALFQSDGLRGVHQPVELWAATLDEIVPLDPDFAIVKDGLPVKPVTHIEPGARHYSFLAPCTPSQLAALHEICADEPGFDRVAFHARLNAAVVAFFKQHL